MCVFQIIEPRAKNIPIDQEKLRRCKADLEVTLDQLEKVYLKDKPYLCGNEISIADLHGTYNFFQHYKRYIFCQYVSNLY